MGRASIGRWLLTPEGPVEGYLRLEGNDVAEVCTGSAPGGAAKALVMKGFVNAHTHLGDSVAYPAPKGSVEELVAPPDGHKHRVLRTTSAQKKLAAMRRSLELMRRTGTSSFIDFREEGLEGIALLKQAMSSNSPRARILGRPTSVSSADSELDALFKSCDGIGMSAIRDWPLDVISRASRRARALSKMFALHASETVRESVDSLIDLKPDFVVHMTRASEDDIVRLGEADIPIVVCPRANEFFGLTPNIPVMLRHGLTVGLGTDNCMITNPDMVEEIKAAYRVSRQLGGISPVEAVNLAVFGGRKLLKGEGNISKEIGIKDDLVVIRVGGDDPLRELVTSARSGDILGTVRGGKVRRTETG